jgi:WhiB family redox-sensing transcriptional regulator
MTWRDCAACLDEDPELLFAVGNSGPALDQIEQAKSVCRRCEVVETFLKQAIESRQDEGVWGSQAPPTGRRPWRGPLPPRAK